ncbi:Tannase/feruloyl esterase [Penicillium cf. griseofulvum]|uniref:Carboxylic ester hydrolase n=1 Tax=Penicillium cf. griseofulvum TaxID=2972120 RepID=A0A9W9J4A9_9EURO|nr:Tannase/feruloyl esterase [Penicillium cf. griseofulvum]KAJ5435232.1 Tannase/feruloyl esterase [Penicillium cf. griseofulvum]
MTRLYALPLFAALGGSLALASEDAFQSKCVRFGDQIDIPNVKVNFAEFVQGGTNLSLADNPPSCGTSDQAISVDLCRVAMAVSTSNSSEITLEAWFPREYKGRFLSTGNGGISGCIQYYDLAYTTQLGFASVGANNGHNGTSGKPFYRSPEVVKDYAYRSVHTGVVVGKELTKQFYKEGFKKSYYLGCSTGGRQGWKSVQKYPNDFDGVVAGAPAINLINLFSWSSNFYSITGSPTSDTFLSTAEWKIVNEEIIRQCDTIDGAKDGIIENPDLCRPVLETLTCDSSASKKTGCLTSAQVNTANQVLSPLYGINGTLLYPRMQPGSEIFAAPIVYNGQPFQYGEDWFRYVVYDDPSWSGANFTVKDAAAALAQNPYNIQTWDGDISPFKKAGGKILHYHGLQDGLISSEDSKMYYAHLDEFYRFFPISGMGHCSAGDGAYGIGQGIGTYDGTNPEDNVLMAMVQWVEEGKAPETVRGTKLSTGPGSKAEYKRKHCRWPRRNVFKGPGHYTDENAWECI